MSIKNQLISQLTSALQELGISDVVPFLDYPGDPKHGDYSTNVAMGAFKSLQVESRQVFKSPMDLAEKIAEKFSVLSSQFSVTAVAPGFINFWISDEVLIGELEKGTDSGPSFAKATEEHSKARMTIPNRGKGRDVVVEYSSPNIAKPFTVGHLRSTIIGDAVANLLEITGWKVHRDNHVGDWGTQFGKQIYAIKEWGDEEEIEKSERPVKDLVALYVKFHEAAQKEVASNAMKKEGSGDATSNVADDNVVTIEDEARAWFKKLEDGDPEARRLWQKCIDWSWKEFDQIYQKLGVSFTENNGRGYGESFFEERMAPVVKELEEKKLLKIGEEGAKLVFFNNSLPPLMILKKDGATLYSTRDLATDAFRLHTYGKDVLIINEVGAEQSLYFQQLYAVEELLGWFKKGQRVHIRHGLYRFKEGKMSTRKGNVIWLEDVLEEAEERAAALEKGTEGAEETDGTKGDLASVVAIGALKWNDLKRDSKQDIVFDWDDILNMQGNSGPYMQYTYARTQSVLTKFQISNVKSQINTPPKADQPLADKYDLEVEERALLVLLSRFGDTVAESAQRYSPNILCTYLFELAQSFNTFYQKHQILKEKEEVRDFRLALTRETGKTIKKGLELLGIEVPERM